MIPSGIGAPQEMAEFSHQITEPTHSVTTTQTQEENAVGIEATAVQPLSTQQVSMDTNLPPVNKEAVGETAEKGREVIEALVDANAALFNKENAERDLKSIEGADRGVVNISLSIFNKLDGHLKRKAESLGQKANRKSEVVSKLEGTVVARRYNSEFGQMQANVESTAMQKMLKEVSGSNEYHPRGKSDMNMFERMLMGTKEFVQLKVAEMRYNHARKEMVKLSARSQRCKLLSDGLGALASLMKGTSERGVLQAQQTAQEAQQDSQVASQSALLKYAAFNS